MLLRIGAVINLLIGLAMTGLAIGLPIIHGTDDMAWTIGVVVGLGTGGLTCLVVSVILWVWAGRRGAQNRLLQTGIPATASIKAVNETGISLQRGMYIVLDFTLLVGPATASAYQVTMRATVPRLALGMVGVGKLVAVRIDPANQNNIAIDWTAAPS